MRPLIFAFLLIISPAPAFAAPQTLPEVRTYDQLLQAIRQVRSTTQQRIEKAVEQEKVRETWETGMLIDRHILAQKERADYGEKVIKRLSDELSTSSRELHYMVEFARAYPIVPAPAQLSWSHYRELLSIEDSKQRDRVAKEAEKNHWNMFELRDQVVRVNASKAGKKIEDAEAVLEVQPGIPNAYRIVRATEGPDKGKLVLDLGFLIFVRPDGIGKFKEGDIVSVSPSRLGVGAGLVPALSGHPPLQLSKTATESDLYTYNAYVIEIIDGDSVPRKTAQEMRVGPSEPICGNGFQSALSGFG